MIEGYVRIATFSTEIEAEVVKAMLASAEIESFLKYEDTGGMMPVLQQAEGVALYVDPKDADEAKTILTSQAAEESG